MNSRLFPSLNQLIASLVVLVSVTVGTLPVRAVDAPEVNLRIEAADRAPRGGITDLVFIAEIPAGWHIHANAPNLAYLVPTELRLTLPPGIAAGTINYPPPLRQKFKFAKGEELLVHEGLMGIATRIEVPGDFIGKRIRVEAVLRYQACNDTTCLPPKEASVEHILPVTEPDPMGGLGTESDHEHSEPSEIGELLHAQGLWATLGFLALLGLGLNLTPCVYPLISITIAYFGGQSHSRGRTALLASVYVLGIALSFSALGVAAALSGGIFGQALQQPAVTVGIALVLVALALANFGLYQFHLPASLMHAAGGAVRGVAGALFMGLTMGIVAAPCVGPIVIGLLVFVGTQQDPVLGFAFFFALAIGMGAPYILLAMSAGAIRHLPRSGDWLVWNERFFGCMLLLLAAYFVSPILPDPIDRWLLPVGLVFSGVYLGFIAHEGKSSHWFTAIRTSIGMAAIAAGIWLGWPTSPERHIEWERVASVDVVRQRLTQQKPLLLDFAADWCLPCREMEHTTYADADVLAEVSRFHALQVDLTEETAETTVLSDAFAVRGVPTLIFFDASGTERNRLVGYVDAEEMLVAMRAVAHQ